MIVRRRQRPDHSVSCIRCAGVPSGRKLAAAGLLSPLQWEIGGWTVKRDLAWVLASAKAPHISPGCCLCGVSSIDAAFIVRLVVVVQWVACWVFVVVAVAVALLLLWPGCQTDSRPSCIVIVLWVAWLCRWGVAAFRARGRSPIPVGNCPRVRGRSPSPVGNWPRWTAH